MDHRKATVGTHMQNMVRYLKGKIGEKIAAAYALVGGIHETAVEGHMSS